MYPNYFARRLIHLRPKVFINHTRSFTQQLAKSRYCIAVHPFAQPRAFVSTGTLPIALEALPEPPIAPIQEAVLNALGEPTLSSLGLCSYWPSGWYQSILESLHVSMDFPWWAAIATTTLVIRMGLVPFIIAQRRSLATYSESIPKLAILQDRMTNARLSGDYFEMMKISKEMQEFMKTGEINPIRSMKLLFVQIPIFLSVFAGIRGMAALPVPSMTTGGLYWFTDLTMADPYFLLPILSMCSILLMVETGADMSTAHMTPMVRTMLRVFPFVGFFMVMNMPCAILWYWTVSNFVSLIQAYVLRLPVVRTRLNLPMVAPPPESTKTKRGFVEGFKETMNNSRLLAEMESRERLDAKQFQSAGRSAVPRTFSYNPKSPPMKQ